MALVSSPPRTTVPGARNTLAGLAGCFVAYGAVFFDRLAPLYVLARIGRDLHAPRAELGLVAAATGLGWAGSTALTRLAARHSPRARAVVAVGGAGLFGIASAVASSWAVFLLLRAAGAVLAGMAAPSITALGFRFSRPRSRGRVLGTVSSSTRLFGSLLAPAVTTWIAASHGWRPALATSGAFAVGGAVVLATLTDRRKTPRGAAPPVGRVRYRPDGRRDVAIAATATAAIAGWLIVTAQTVPPLLAGWLRVGPAAAGRLMAMFGAGGFAASLLVPALSDRAGRARTTAAACTAGGAAGICLAAAASLHVDLPGVAVAALLVVAGTALGALPLAMSVIPGEAIRHGDVGQGLVLPMITAEVLGGALLPVLAGRATAAAGPGVAVALAGACLVAVAPGTRLLSGQARARRYDPN